MPPSLTQNIYIHMPSKKGSKRQQLTPPKPPSPIIIPVTHKQLKNYADEVAELREYPFLHRKDLPPTVPLSEDAKRAMQRNRPSRNTYALWDIKHSQIRKSKIGGKRRKHKKTAKKSCSWW